MKTGYLGEIQKQQFQERLSELPQIRSILEIGFNAGHSAECFFESCKNLESLVSVDVCLYPYTKIAAEYMKNRYPKRFYFVKGDSLQTIPLFSQYFPDKTFDLIYIDGSHFFQHVLKDIQNAGRLAHKDTLLWIDDIHYPEVNKAVQFCEAINRIEVRKVFASNDSKRLWVEAKYFLVNNLQDE